MVTSGRGTWANSLRDAAGVPRSEPRQKTEWTSAVTGQAPKAVAEVQFDTAGRKRLLIKIAPIEKL
jgi:DNA helicase-2/ATP-dependent DNA helicase PcrA